MLLPGAKADPGGAVLVWLAVRMGRYLSEPADEPNEDLVPAYMSALETLSTVLGSEPADMQGGASSHSCYQSHQLLLWACLLTHARNTEARTGIDWV